MIMQRTEDYEQFSQMRVQEGVYFAVRADGHNFHVLTRKMKKPYDEEFRRLMNETISEYLLLRVSLPFFTFSFSDEISFIFRKEDEMFSRRVEKLDSLTASALSAIFSREMSTIAYFDSRVAVLSHFEDVMNYLAQRQAEAKRNCINSYTFYTMISEGVSARGARETMDNWDFSDMETYLRKRDIFFDKLEQWQLRGTAFYWKPVQKTGFNPLTGKQVTAGRLKLIKDETLPDLGITAGRKLVENALKARS
jgi:tRNA(His) 5'-end guanylyltransferase